jgi:hypothetical protein
MSITSLRRYVMAHWQTLAGITSLLAVSIFLLFWRLNTLVPGYSPNEINTYVQGQSFHNILTNPTNLLYTGIIDVAGFLHLHHILIGRIISGLIGLGVVGMFYWLIQNWHGRRIAWMATILFVTSSRFLHTARLGTPQILLFGLFFLVAYGFWLKERKQKLRFALPAALVITCLLVYTPGMIWFIIAGIIWQWRTIVDKVAKTPLWLTGVAIVPVLALLFPLVWSIVKHPKLAETFIGLPQPFPHISTILHNLWNIPLQLFYTHSTITSDLGTPALLTLDSLAIVMFIFGAYLYLKHFKLVRTNFLIGIFVIACALISLGTMSVSVMLPFIYMIVAAGISYLLGQWLDVFPRNVIARSTGIVLLSFIIALSCTYNLRRYFVAWPTSTNTRQIFSRHQS